MKININQTKFLNKDTELAHKDILVVANEGIWEDSVRFKRPDGTPQSQFNVEFKLKDGNVRGTSLNWTNVKLLVKAFGDDSITWIGKEVRAWKTKSEKAKSGFSYIFVPIDWIRDEVGEWVDATGKIIDVEIKREPSAVKEVEDDGDEINPDEIPF